VGKPVNLKSLSAVVFTVMVGIVGFFVGALLLVGFLVVVGAEFRIFPSNSCAEVNMLNNASIAKTTARV